MRKPIKFEVKIIQQREREEETNKKLSSLKNTTKNGQKKKN